MTHSNRVLVTGASGNLGSHLMPALIEQGFSVTGLDLASPTGDSDIIKADLAHPDEYCNALDGVDVIVHCASIHPWKSYTDEQYIDCNIKASWCLYEAAAERGVSKIVLTSSIAANGYGAIPPSAWSVTEDEQFPILDLYSLTKHTQEEIAKRFAVLDKVATLALRPPAFMPKDPVDTAFSLTGSYALVEDMVSAHVAAVEVMVGLRTPTMPVNSFEAVFTTNALPYKPEDAALVDKDGSMRALVKKYWPEAYDWLEERDYKQGWLAAVYDLSKAERILGWRPRWNFAEWFAEHHS